MAETTEQQFSLQKYVGLRSGTLLVLANIIGAGIFTTTGYQAADLGHPGFILALWVIGGVLALCGALCYAELGAAMPRGGAEYVYLSQTYGGVVGFMSAFVSLFAGFSAPIASATKGFSRYLTHWFPSLADDPTVFGIISAGDLIAVGVVWILIAIQLRGSQSGLRFSDAITAFKVVGIVAFIVAAAAVGKGDAAGLTTVSTTFGQHDRTGLLVASATSLVFVMFCYSGWNASAYIAGEFKDTQRSLPWSLILGTALVLVLYLGLNIVYFYGADVTEMAGVAEVGLVAARHLFGDVGVSLVTLVLCASLLASATAMTIIGPRVSVALGQDYPVFRALARISGPRGVPATALIVQGVVTTVIIVSGRIDQIMQYAGFTLSIFASLAVSCVIVLRFTRPDLPRPFRTWGYPVTPLLFLSVSGWMMFWSFQGRPLESTLGLLTAAAGGVIFYLSGVGQKLQRADS